MYVLIYVTGIGVCIHAYTKIGSKSMFMQVHVHVRMHTCICVNDPSQGCIPAWIDRTELRGWWAVGPNAAPRPRRLPHRSCWGPSASHSILLHTSVLISLSFSLSACWFISLAVYLSVCWFTSQAVCLSVSLFLHSVPHPLFLPYSLLILCMCLLPTASYIRHLLYCNLLFLPSPPAPPVSCPDCLLFFLGHANTAWPQ